MNPWRTDLGKEDEAKAGRRGKESLEKELEDEELRSNTPSWFIYSRLKNKTN